MIIHDYDNTSEPIFTLEAFYGPKKHLVDKCLITFSNELQNYLIQNFSCSILGHIHSANGQSTIYALEYHGQQIAFYLSGITSALAAGICYEVHWITGATKFIMCGSCGQLDKDKIAKRYIVPTECYRGDGISYYFAPPTDYLPVKNAQAVMSIFDELKIPYIDGRVWTTDAMIHETANLVSKRKSEGCIAVEMELAGVESVCDFYGLDLYNFLDPGDTVELDNYTRSGLHGANHDTAKIQLALEIARRI